MITEIKNQFPLYLCSIQQTIAGSNPDSADQASLVSSFELGMLLSCILENSPLCNDVFISNVSEFCVFVEQAMLPPDFSDGASFSWDLASHNGKSSDFKLPVESVTQVSKLFKTVLLDLMSGMQMALLDLCVKQKTIADLSALDIENTNYVIGMIEITLMNFGSFIAQGGNTFKTHSELHRFFSDTTRFAASLQANRVGIAD